MTGADILYFVVKGPLANMWPMLLLPAIAGGMSYWAAKRLPPTRANPWIAAALAAAPGALMLVLAVGTTWRIATHAHYDPSWQHLLKYQVTAVVAALILGRAVWRAVSRQRAVSRLVRLSREPAPRLAKAAARAGLRARQLPCNDAECFVAGALRPTAYLSSGTLQRLSDEELEAALRHERAHVAGGDVLILSILGFLRDLAPGGGLAFVAYQEARERTADEAAARISGPLPLASALLALARGPQRPLPAIGIAAGADWRLRAILDAEAPFTGKTPSIGPAFALAATLALAAWPQAQSWIIANLCACHL